MTKTQLAKDLKKLGVRKDIDLLVHSSLKRIGKIDGAAEAVIDCLLGLIGPTGTLMAPTHTWGTVNAAQPIFDVRRTPSHVGYFTEAVRKRPEAIRSLHPCHSVAAIGPRAEFYTAGQLEVDTPCPAKSPYGRLIREVNGYILFLGVDLEYNTCYHAIEEEAKVPGLLTEHQEELQVIDETGTMHACPHYRHAEPGPQRFFRDMEFILRDAGALSINVTGQGVSRLVSGIKLRKVILDVIRKQPGVFIRSTKK